MKKLILIFPALLMLGCSVQQDCCETDNLQCDEMYPYYNCPSPSQVYHYRDYKRTWSNSYTSGWNSYYPNTQIVYYVPIQRPVDKPVDNGNILYNTPRPGSFTTFRERDQKPVNKPTRTRRE